MVVELKLFNPSFLSAFLQKISYQFSCSLGYDIITMKAVMVIKLFNFV